jgi:integrase
MFWVSLSHNSAANDRQSTGIDRLRHHLASLLIDSGCDVKTVQARMRHSSAKTTLDVYGHMWPDKDETTRAAIGGVIAARVASSSEDPAGALRAKRS